MRWERFPTMRALARLIGLFGSSHLLVFSVICTVVLAGLEITTSYLIKQLLDAAITQNFLAFRWLVWLMLAITVALMGSRFLRNRLTGIYCERGICRLRELMLDRLLHLSGEEAEKHHSGDIISRMTNDLNQIKEFTTQSLLDVIYHPLAGLGAFIYLLTLNWQLTVISTFGIPVIYNLSSLVSKPIAKYATSLQEQLSVVNRETQETINGIEVVRSYGLEMVFGSRFNRAVDESVQSALKVSFLRSVLLGVSLFVNISPFFICFGFGGYWVIRGQMTTGALIAFITLLNPLTFPISKLPTLLGELRAQMVSANRVFEVLDLPVERVGGGDYEPAPDEPVVVFEDVEFAYQDGEQILAGATFEIQTGEMIALVGPSGSGKSTIFKLLLGRFSDFSGDINVYGRSIRDWSLERLRDQFSLVLQDTYLFPGTIADNIRFGKARAIPAEVVAAAEVAYAHDFIRELPEGYKTDVGEFGDNLSGGQKQRICLARAILKNAPIYLLDEATSSLDTQSEGYVRQALEDLMTSGVTSIVISHRLSTVQKADRILVLDQGRIVESGTHEELIAINGVYKNMCVHQLTQEPGSALKEAAV